MPQDARVVEFDPKSFIQLLDTVQKSMVQYLKGPVGEIKFFTKVPAQAGDPGVDCAVSPAGLEIGAGDTVGIKNDHTEPVEVKIFDQTVFGLVQLILPEGCGTLLTVSENSQPGQLAWEYLSDNAGGGTQPITVRPPQN